MGVSYGDEKSSILKEKIMKWILVFMSIFFSSQFVQSQAQWRYDQSWANTLHNAYLSQGDLRSKRKVNITKEQEHEVAQNVIFFFAAQQDTRRDYVSRVLAHWKKNMGLGLEEANLLARLSDQMFTASDQEILNTFNQLKAVNENEALDALLDQCGASQMKATPPSNKFEVNEVGVIMGGLWGGVIAVSVLEMTKELILNIIPGSKLLRGAFEVLFGYLSDAVGFIGKVVGQGASVAVQWVGHTIKNLFGGKGKEKAMKPKKKKTKSVIALPNGSGDCCGLPFPTF